MQGEKKNIVEMNYKNWLQLILEKRIIKAAPAYPF